LGILYPSISHSSEFALIIDAAGVYNRNDSFNTLVKYLNCNKSSFVISSLSPITEATSSCNFFNISLFLVNSYNAHDKLIAVVSLPARKKLANSSRISISEKVIVLFIRI